MMVKYLAGTLIFLAIVNLVAVDTYLYYTLVRNPDARSPGVTGSVAGAPAGEGGVSKLDAAQRKEIGRIKNDFRRETGEIYGRIGELEDEMYRLVQEDPVSQEKIDRNLAEHGALRLRLKRIAIEKMIETRSILTADQKRELFKAIFRTPPRGGSGKDHPDTLDGSPRMNLMKKE
jgi:hypothetical protein